MLWIVHPVAAVVLAMYAGIVWVKGADGNRRALVVTALLLVLAVLGAGWVVHPAAAISLAACFAFAGGNLFKRHSNEGMRVLASTALFGLFCAAWVFIPLAVATAIALMGGKHGHHIHGHGHRARNRSGGRREWQAKRAQVVNTWPPTQVVPPKSEPQPATAGAQSLTVLAQHPRLPADSAKRAKALNLQCFETLAYLNERGEGAAKLRFELEQIHTDFAVEAIRSYLALPPTTANSLILHDGKTGQDLLNEQLDLLSEGVHDVQHRAEELGAEQILTSHLFVQEKFGQRARDLKL